jgi:hypothetical protein
MRIFFIVQLLVLPDLLATTLAVAIQLVAVVLLLQEVQSDQVVVYQLWKLL